MAPLNALVRLWRTEGGTRRQVPWFDPDAGGIGARVLLLTESPAPRTIRAGGDGFCSEDNADRTNQWLRTERIAAGLEPADCLRWNVVPWAVIDDRGRPRPLRSLDLAEARPALDELRRLLTDLVVVITFGQHALRSWMRTLTLDPGNRLVSTLAVPHPSPANAANRDETTQRIRQSLLAAANEIHRGAVTPRRRPVTPSRH